MERKRIDFDTKGFSKAINELEEANRQLNKQVDRLEGLGLKLSDEVVKAIFKPEKVMEEAKKQIEADLKKFHFPFIRRNALAGMQSEIIDTVYDVANKANGLSIDRTLLTIDNCRFVVSDAVRKRIEEENSVFIENENQLEIHAKVIQIESEIKELIQMLRNMKTDYPVKAIGQYCRFSSDVLIQLGDDDNVIIDWDALRFIH